MQIEYFRRRNPAAGTRKNSSLNALDPLRTTDSPDLYTHRTEWKLLDTALSSNRAFGEFEATYPIHEGTKINGTPSWIQPAQSVTCPHGRDRTLFLQLSGADGGRKKTEPRPSAGPASIESRWDFY